MYLEIVLCDHDDDDDDDDVEEEEEEEEGDIDGNFQKWLPLETRDFFHIYIQVIFAFPTGCILKNSLK